jgi:hypothetical protein
MSYLEDIMIRLDQWMNYYNFDNPTYTFKIEKEIIYVYLKIDNNIKNIATVDKNLQYTILKKIEIINNQNDLNEWMFLQETNFHLIRILSSC